nr:hemolysin family protein [Saprospiraceae bacterium]
FGIHAVHGADIHSSDELKYLVQQSGESGTIVNTDYEIIKNAFDFADRTVKQVMVPRNQIVAIDVDAFDTQMIDRVLQEGYSRIPCYENNIDNIVGLVYVKDLLAILNKGQVINLKEIIRPVIITTETRKIGSLLKEFQQKHIQMAIVVDEFGGIDGIATMEDIIEELVGEIQDEYDNEIPVVEKINDTTFHVMATSAINDINALLPYALESVGDATTLAGVIIHKLGRIPVMNEKGRLDEYEFTILKRIKNTIISVQLKVVSE